ncbi:MAG: hypothetical protein DHS20C13_00940 [Thermodesulfobacteriota bacterium]|nr:MAG: hypothetical protein DHS20C13_00940 [Thermodesulfobacteriota bacterium]
MRKGLIFGSVFLSFIFLVVVVFLLFPNSKLDEQSAQVSSEPSQFEEVPKLMLPVLAETLGRNNDTYHIERESTKFKAVTASQGFESEFGKNGVTFSRDNKNLIMRLVGSNEIDPITVSKNKVEYNRGNITEWYVNSPLGIEQGFTLNNSPEKRSSDGKVVLEIGLEIDDEMQVRQTEDGNSINFISSDNNKEVFRYRGLFAFDSSGKELPSEMKLLDSKIKILVDDRGAEYPIVIDPFIEIQKILPSDAKPNVPPSWQFGGTVHISGNTAIVGAIHANGFLGEAYIFDRDTRGFWSETQILQGSNVNTFGDFFGNCVHIDRNTAIVGASHVLNAASPGEAYIYERDTTTNLWSEVDILTGSTSAPGSFYGISCTLEESSGIAMVGANRAFAVEGRAYVYQRDTMGMWNETQVLSPSGGMPNFQFGFKINFQGDIAAIGAPGLIGFPVGDRVYIYQRDSNTGLWIENQIITGSDTMAGDAFGVDVDFDGDNMVIGASQFNMNEGKAYFFERDPMTNMWFEVDIVTADMPVMGEFFGSNVSISGDIAIISAALLITTNGRVLVYERDNMGMWSEVQELTASDGMVGDQFGVETSIDGNQLIVGANGVDGAAGPLTGAAYLYGNPVPPTRAVPTLNGWAIIAMTGFLGLFGVYAIRKRMLADHQN